MIDEDDIFSELNDEEEDDIFSELLPDSIRSIKEEPKVVTEEQATDEEVFVEQQLFLEDTDELFTFDPEYDDIQRQIDIDDIVGEEREEQTAQQIVEKEFKKYLLDTLYICSKIWREEKRTIMSTQYNRIQSFDYNAGCKDRANPEGSLIANVFKSCVEPIIKNMQKKGLISNYREMREECGNIFFHVMNVSSESLCTGVRKEFVDYAGKWSSFIETSSEKTKFNGGVMHIPPILITISPEQAITIFEDKVAKMEDSSKSVQEIPKDLQRLTSVVTGVIQKSPKSKPMYGEINTLSIGSTDGYIADTDAECLNRMCVARRISLDGNRVVGECECGTQVDVTDNLSIIENEHKNRYSTVDYYKVRPAICTNCEREVFIHHAVAKQLLLVIKEKMQGDKRGTNSKSEGKLNYFILYTLNSLIGDSNYISLGGQQKELSIKDKRRLELEVTEYMTALFDKKGSKSTYSNELELLILNKNGCKVNMSRICEYIYECLSEKSKEMLEDLAKVNKIQLQKYIDFKICGELELLKLSNASIASELNNGGKKIIDTSKVRKVIEPYKEIPDSELVGIEGDIKTIVGSKIDMDRYNRINGSKEPNDFMHFSRLGVTIERMMREEMANEFILNIFNEFIISKVSGRVGNLMLPQNTPISSKDCNELASLIKNEGKMTAEELYGVLCKNVEPVRSIAVVEYKESMKSIYKDCKPEVSISLNGEIGEEADYLLQLRTADKVMRDFMGLQGTNEFEVTYEDTGKDVDECLQLDVKQILLLAILKAFDRDRWKNPEIYDELMKKYEELM